MQRALLFPVLLAAAWALPARAQVPPADAFRITASVQTLSALLAQPDGKVIVAGVNYLARHHPDGSKDAAFSPSVNNTVYSLALQPDGKVLAGGEFTSLAGYSSAYIGRLNTNGTLDTTFTATLSGRAQVVLLQPDGKVLVGGRAYVSPVGYTGYVLRLNANGTRDTSFSVSGGVNGPVSSMALQEDGKILIGGLFLYAGSLSRQHLARLNSNGALDTTFNPGTDGIVTALALQADGAILVGGSFNTVAGLPRTNLARLFPDGTLDAGFDPRVTGNNYPTVYSLAVQANGRITLGGIFNGVSGSPRQNLARLNADGTLDDGFDSGANNNVYGLALQKDGKMFVAGDFGTLAGQSRLRIGRLLNTSQPAESMTLDGSTLTWLRDGSSPEVWRTTFESSTNLTKWTFLGAGTRVPGGWQIGGLSASLEGRIRARGYVAGAGFNGSSWSVDTISGPCFFLDQPSGSTNNAGTTATLSARVEGTPPLSYQWLKNGSPVDESRAWQGSQMPSLSLTNVLSADQGNYSVVVSNLYGAVTSAVAFLKVIDPCVTTTFLRSYANAGETRFLAATATGTAPLSFQWLKDGSELPGATNAALTLTNLRGSDIGIYAIRVSNSFGVAVSNLFDLQVNLAMPDDFAPTTDTLVCALAEQTNSQILLGGSFTAVNGEPRTLLARLSAGGILGSPFGGMSSNGTVYAVAVQPGGSIIAAGGFSAAAGTATNYNLARFNSVGVLDLDYNGTAPSSVLALAQQPDGKLLIGGWLPTSIGGLIGNLRRLNPDGSFDPGFDPGADYVVRSVAVQPDGKILVGGGFNHLAGQTRLFLGRLNADGSIDNTFTPSANNYVNCLVVQADGKILVGGEFTTLNGFSRNRIGRLEPDGTMDYAFNPGASNYASSVVYTMALQADGKIIVGGQFSHLGGEPRANIGRLLPDGRTDPTFIPVADRSSYTVIVQGVAVLKYGGTLVGGAFDSLSGQPRQNVGRLMATDPALDILACDGSKITWTRGGTSPEVWRAAFDYTTNATDWVSLGAATRVAGGWCLTNSAVPLGATLRARGFVVGGSYSGSSWFVESTARVANRPMILVSDGFFGVQSNRFGFQVQAAPAQLVVIESSTNLLDWVPMTTNSSTDGLFKFSEDVLYRARFYRAHVLAPGQ